MTAITDLAPIEAQKLVRQGQAIIIDVREKDEWEEGRIPGARLVPLAQISLRAPELPRDRTIILQCRSGARSRSAAETLRSIGFARLANLRGGIIGWASAGLPVEG